MTYQVAIRETLQRIVPIEADSKEEAERIAEKEYCDEKHVLTSEDFVGVEFETSEK